MKSVPSTSRHRTLMVSAALSVGVMVALQSRINAELSGFVGGGLIAAAISFGTGLVLAAALILSRRHLRAAFTAIPGLLRSGGLRWWQLVGGVGGAWLVTTQGLVVGAVGVTVFTIGVVAGQVGGSLLVDRAGLSPAGHMPLTPPRVLAALIALIAVVASGLQAGGSGGLLSWLVLLSFSAGIGISVQQAINGRVAAATHQPLAATLVNFVVGFSALCVATIVALATNLLAFGQWPSQWWLYLGGPIGVAFIALAAWAVRGVGVLVFGLLSIAGQLLGAVLLDLLLPSGASLGWPQWLALGLILLAALIATNGGNPRWGRGR